MTSIRFHFRPSKKQGTDEGRLFVRIIHKRRPGTIPTGYLIFTSEWDEENEELLLPQDNPERHRYLTELRKKLKDIRSILEKSIIEHSLRGDYEVEDIVKSYVRTPKGDMLRDWCDVLKFRLIDNGQIRTARAYGSAVTSFQKFLDDNQLTVYNFTSSLFKRYETWLRDRGRMMNTISFYMRNLRAIYNKALKENVLEVVEEKPFRDVFTGFHPTRHRALSEKELNSLSELESHLSSLAMQKNNNDIRKQTYNLKLQNALDYFLFCFHARGMSWVDMAYLKKSEIKGDTIVYKRKKTGGILEVKITEPMRLIMDRYSERTEGSPYVFPVINADGNERAHYVNGLNVQNRLLGELSKMAGLQHKVTTHVSRHTWASIAKQRKVEIAVISEALGHSSIRTTAIYLDSFGRPVLDSVSEKISSVIKTDRKTVRNPINYYICMNEKSTSNPLSLHK